MLAAASSASLRRAVRLVAALNFAYFGIEFVIAAAIGSVSLFADSVDFLEDTSVNLLILLALNWRQRWRARVGMLLSCILLVPAAATIWALWQKLTAQLPPDPTLLSLTGLGALAVNLFCALTLARHCRQGGSLTRAAFLSARNDTLANVAIIVAGQVTAHLWNTVWPDVMVGAAIAAMNADAAREVYQVARSEHREAKA